MLQERNFSGDAEKTDLTTSLASTKGKQGWSAGCSHSDHTHLSCGHQRRAGTSVPPFSAGHKAGVWSVQLLQKQCHLCSARLPGVTIKQGYPLLDELEMLFFYSFAGRTIFYLTSYNNNFCSDMGLQFDVHLYTPCMLSLLLKIIFQATHLLLIHYLSSNKDVLLFAIAAYSAQHIAGWYFPSLITRAIWFIITRIALTLLTNKGHYPWLQKLLEQMKRPSVCITQQLWELALPPTFLFQMSGVSEMCQGFRVVITSIWAENKLL